MLKLLFSPIGAIHRLQFFYGFFGIFLFLFICEIAISFIIKAYFGHDIIAPTVKFMLHKTPHAIFSQANFEQQVAILSFMFIFAALLWSNFCLALKRIRDLNIPAWLIIFYYVYYFCPGNGFKDKWNWLTIITFVVYVVATLALFFWPSRLAEDDDEHDDAQFKKLNIIEHDKLRYR
jgi:uncharacterized membrane protein YhaH (DUF805 family)